MKAKAEAGDANYQMALGHRYEKREGVAKDPVEAAKWYRKAAEQNDVDAQYNLGMCYERARAGRRGLGRGLQVAVAGSEARP